MAIKLIDEKKNMTQIGLKLSYRKVKNISFLSMSLIQKMKLFVIIQVTTPMGGWILKPWPPAKPSVPPIRGVALQPP